MFGPGGSGRIFFYRLNVVPIRIPSLTEAAREDVPLLARSFMQRASEVGGITCA